MPARRDGPRRLGHRPVLDGLRGIAILLVMLTHTDLLPNGYVGVDLFFALSGFLITSLLYEEWDRGGRINLRRFYGRRARRLLPGLGLLILLALVVDLGCYRMTGWPFPWKALSSALFVNNWLAATGHANDLGSLNPTWSLAQEEQFYLLWPLALVLLLRRGAGPRIVAVTLLAGIAGLLALAPTGAGVGYSVYYSPATRTAELLFGCLGAVVWRHRLIRVPSGLLRVLPPSLLAFVLARRAWRRAAAVALTYLFLVLLADDQLATERVYLTACLLAVPLIITLIGAPEGLLARLVAAAPLRALGRISYGLYLFHLLARNVVYHYLPAGSLYLNAALSIGISVVLAAASWWIIESRVLARGGRASAARPRRPAVQGLVPVRI